MPGTMKHTELKSGKLDRIAVFYKTIRLNILSLGDAMLGPLLSHFIQQKLIIFVRSV